MQKIAGSGSGSVSQRHGSADPDPDQNVMDPQHWLLVFPPFIHKLFETVVVCLSTVHMELKQAETRRTFCYIV
jgi:hypothetical protein